MPNRKPIWRVLASAAFLYASAHAQQRNITLTPAVVEAGSPELIRVDVPGATSVEGEWLNRPIHFFPSQDHQAQNHQAQDHPVHDHQAHDHQIWFALAGVDVEAPTGESTLKITLKLQGATKEITTPVPIHPAHYRTSSITVPPKFVEPDPAALKQIEAESKLKHQVFAAAESNPSQPLWSGSFEAPVPAQPTDSFGTRRMFNGKLASIHKGTDFKAATGTPVHAANSGVVILAQPLYYEGNCVMIDHGDGLISYSMHLSRIDVKPGEPLRKGQQIGLSGATGRVTGPHLHWAIRWQGAMLDPAKLLKMNLNNLH